MRDLFGFLACSVMQAGFALPLHLFFRLFGYASGFCVTLAPLFSPVRLRKRVLRYPCTSFSACSVTQAGFALPLHLFFRLLGNESGFCVTLAPLFSPVR
jgi:hypothetical protein